MRNRKLIAYYSMSGNTRKVAELIAWKTGADLFEITPVKAYKSLYLGGGTRIKKERAAGELPLIKLPLPALNDYDVIFIGTPNWGGGLAQPVKAFLSQEDSTNKILLPFCTHGGGGLSHIAEEIKSLCPQARVLPALSFHGNGGAASEQEVIGWLAQIEKLCECTGFEKQ